MRLFALIVQLNVSFLFETTIIAESDHMGGILVKFIEFSIFFSKLILEASIFPVSDSILNYVSHNISSRHDTGQTSIA
jgi:hypothetical protein